jgi:hypothetical protein
MTKQLLRSLRPASWVSIWTSLHLILLLPIALAQSPKLSDGVTEGLRIKSRNDYAKTRANLEEFRASTAKNYATASAAGKKEILKTCRTRLETDLATRIFPAWYGTTWAFHGISEQPGNGEIACGYFVSTCLVHTGFKAPRIKLAQQASQKIIATFMKRPEYKISAGKTIAQIRSDLKKSGDGLYLVGLDTHVGFISVRGKEMVFVHSSYYKPEQEVKAEPIDSTNPLKDSNYRVIGKLFSDPMLIKWLQGQRFAIP